MIVFDSHKTPFIPGDIETTLRRLRATLPFETTCRAARISKLPIMDHSKYRV